MFNAGKTFQSLRGAQTVDFAINYILKQVQNENLRV